MPRVPTAGKVPVPAHTSLCESPLHKHSLRGSLLQVHALYALFSGGMWLLAMSMRHAAGGGPAPMRLPTPALTGSTAKGSRCCAHASVLLEWGLATTLRRWPWEVQPFLQGTPRMKCLLGVGREGFVRLPADYSLQKSAMVTPPRGTLYLDVWLPLKYSALRAKPPWSILEMPSICSWSVIHRHIGQIRELACAVTSLVPALFRSWGKSRFQVLNL